MNPNANRADVLLKASLRLGAGWALALRDELAVAGRAVEGGWPGTIHEARARVAAHFGKELPGLGMASLRADELALVTRSAYDQAKRDWRRMARGA